MLTKAKSTRIRTVTTNRLRRAIGPGAGCARAFRRHCSWPCCAKLSPRPSCDELRIETRTDRELAGRRSLYITDKGALGRANTQTASNRRQRGNSSICFSACPFDAASVAHLWRRRSRLCVRSLRDLGAAAHCPSGARCSRELQSRQPKVQPLGGAAVLSAVGFGGSLVSWEAT